MNLNEAMTIFGENLSILIGQRNWTVQYAARELEYGRNDLSAVINGAQNIQLKTVVRFARYFNTAVFLMFSRQFDNEEFRRKFPFVEADYMNVFCENFQRHSLQRSIIELDAATVSKILNGKYKNPTIKTLHIICLDSGIQLSEMLKTIQERQVEEKEKTL